VVVLALSIRPAHLDDVPSMIEIERAASDMYRSLSMDFVADDDPGSPEELEPYVRDRRAFVATDAADRPIAYIILDAVDGAAHIEQVSVHPEHARQGIGRTLIERGASWAREHNLRSLTLTTYVDVPWNAPYYERLGFRRLAPVEETPGLRMIRDHERAAGLEVWPRTSMSRRVDSYSRGTYSSSKPRSRKPSDA
jgi:GNAT superfamily N-acetyltransferase